MHSDMIRSKAPPTVMAKYQDNLHCLAHQQEIKVSSISTDKITPQKTRLLKTVRHVHNTISDYR